MKNLVIVESPNKVSTIQKYLGNDYQVIASVGHILKLKTSGTFGLGIDMEKWEPEYQLDSSKRNIASEIKKALKKSDFVYIATDPDREGEAIGSHIVNYFKIKDNYARIKYNEITKDAILKSIEKATTLDEALIDAQKARRMLDRIIGFRLSYLMRGKLKNTPGTPSAGRVQSIALKLVVDKENEIRKFIPEKYFKLNAKLVNNEVLAYYFDENNSADRRNWILENQIEVLKSHFQTTKKELKVVDVEVKSRKVSAVSPFKQAVLYRRSSLNSQATQFAAQKLYEGYGDGGLISYPRTDSTRLSQTFIDSAHQYILNKWGQEYIADDIKGFSGDQDAHEAIRPTDVALTPELAKAQYPDMTNNEFKVYKLIYENTLQALIKQPIRQNTTYTYLSDQYKFKNNYSKIIFDGYYVITGKEEEVPDPNYQLNQIVDVESFNFEQHETKPPARYSDGALIEALDNIKVGRPSTFATTVKIIKERNYVQRQAGKLVPTEFGEIVIQNLIRAFPDIINEVYTAEVEKQLDDISESQINKNDVMSSFWTKFTEEFEHASEKIEPFTFALTQLPTPCPEDQGILVIRTNKKGQQFVACKNFPKCKFTRSIEASDNLEQNTDDQDEDQ
ncbi:type I DNA topoisomerase [Mycoplasma sp. NEAQ87857]|uniref:type I DNA topoisomerase n=1 Tax=Mycoplasma sp. NEAQ87857 TaxID=2683967 RepID=UPI001317F43B|nr:type I DNA topoisomerase [Mycoplasma sp. NEAQ87857]QGZ97212.1 type I DNA topoisomerase [Mycoplasma sp. NEAQ87857]